MTVVVHFRHRGWRMLIKRNAVFQLDTKQANQQRYGNIRQGDMGYDQSGASDHLLSTYQKVYDLGIELVVPRQTTLGSAKGGFLVNT